MSKRTLKHKPYLKLKGILVEKALTQKSLATLLLISPSTLNQKINGKFEFYYSEVEKICDFLQESTEIFRTTKVK